MSIRYFVYTFCATWKTAWMKTINANLPCHLSRRALTSRKRKSLNDARQMLKKGFQVDAYEDLAFQ